MRSLILIAALMFYASSSLAQYYEIYPAPAYPPPVNYDSRTVPQYVQTIENNGPQVDQRRNMERMNRQIEYQNAIRNYELIYGDTYRR